jgi:hypothetical protein
MKGGALEETDEGDFIYDENDKAANLFPFLYLLLLFFLLRQ